MFRIEAIAVALIGGLAATVAQADVYRWTDPQGHVQYSDRWVPGSTRIMTTSPHGATNPVPSEQTDSQKLAASNASAQQQAQQDAEKTVKRDMAANKAEQCKRATEAYQKAIESRRIYKEGKDGERQYISDKEADAYRARLLLERKATCGK